MHSLTQYAVQRKHQRYVFSQSLTVIHWLSPTDVRREPAIGTEISEGGMSAIVTEPLKAGDEVELIFDLTPGKPICLKAIVRNQFHFRHGFEFIAVDQDKRERIRAACASLMPYEGGWY